MRHVDNPNPARDPVPAPHWSVVLRALRIASGISQEGWAARLGYGRRTIQRWEHAELAPDAAATDALVGLCADYGLFREHRNGVLSGRTLSAYGLCAMLAEARVDGSGVQTTAAELAPAKGLQLPAALTTFIGRDQEISALLRLLSTTRLLTLTGPGGAGKTRLAHEVARLASIDFPDGVRVIELASIAESEIVPQAVATVLGIREQPGRLVLATLAERLSDRKLLILLDNCEHVVAASAELAATLLHACPHLRVLATSRAVLGVSGETTWPVPALSVPDLSHASEPEVVARSEAAQLFVERARAAAPDFALTLETSPAVSEICTRIDGLPLAIELAAAWTRVLSPQELAQRLMHPLPLLVTGARDAPTRQQTLRATLDWSYFLLAPPEQRLLARLSVFAGGATLSAIERVGGDGRESALAVLPRLARLIDASLVQRLDSSGTEPRYRLLETVRQYAGERLLEQGEQDAIRGRHAALFRDVAEEGRRRLRGPEQAVWLDRFERDHENMRAALAWALEREDAELIGRLAAGLWAFWYRRGYVREGRAALDAALALPTTSGLAGVRVQMLQGNTLLAQYHGDYSAARRYAEQGERIARDQGDARSLGEMLGAVGFVCRVQEDWDAARKAFGESLAVAREVGNVFGEAASLHHLGLLALESAHDNATAWSLNQQSLGLFRRLGDRRMECNVLHALARVARARNDVETARSLVAEASIACQEIGDDGVMVYVLYERAAVAAATGRLEQAVRLTAAAEKMTELLGMYVHPVYVHPGESARFLAAARRALGDQRFASAWRRGQAATLEETIAQALADTVED